VKKVFAVLGALLLVVASAGASTIYSISIDSTTKSAATNFSFACSDVLSTCAGIQISQLSVSSAPGAGATLSSLVVGSSRDVATFTGASTGSWTFDLDTSAITGTGTFDFTSSSNVSEGSSGLVAVSGALSVSKTTAMSEPMAFWSLFLVLVPLFFVGWRQGRIVRPHSQVTP
jgi:hypothetical protein